MELKINNLYEFQYRNKYIYFNFCINFNWLFIMYTVKTIRTKVVLRSSGPFGRETHVPSL